MKKTSPSMMHRYNGTAGRQHLIEALRAQPIVAGNKTLAQRLIDVGKLIDVREGQSITQQGNSDNDLFLIVSGQLNIIINDRVVATRGSGCYVGEMALLDPTARRSATVTVAERSVLLRVTETDLTAIALKFPDVWRRMAVELAARLRERSKFIPQPNSTPVVFVASSGEALDEANWISKSLNRRPCVSELWTKGVFQLSKTVLEDLMRMATKCDFAVALLTPDDMTDSRDIHMASPRDNVVFELGLFMGALGRERTFIVTPRDINIKLPTDLLGVTHVQFTRGNKATLGKRLSPVTRSIWGRVTQLGPR